MDAVAKATSMLNFLKSLTGQHRLEYENKRLQDKVDWQDEQIKQFIREQRSHNKARAIIQDSPQYDYSDPDYQTFDEFRKGEKTFTELEGMKAVNWFIKFNELLKTIAYEHYYAFSNGDFYDNIELVLEEIHPGGFGFSVYQVCDQFGDRYGRNKRNHFVPIDFLWTNWKQRCKDEETRKKAEYERTQAEARAEQEKRHAARKAEQYKKAKQVIKNYQQEKDKDGSTNS